ncbi:MAG: phosphate ABC transporter substrate-binding protein [Planctomycetota bacterium]
MRKSLFPSVPVVVAASFAIVSAAAAQVTVDAALPKYEATDGVSGKIKSVGSDTMNNLMTLWGEGFRAIYPNVQVEIEGKGSGTAPPALIAGTATFGPMSREMKSKELDEFEKRFGYKPAQLSAAIDMLAVFVHKDNPLGDNPLGDKPTQGLTLKQLDGIFSKTHKGGHGEIRTWGELGLTGEWANKPISLYGRNSASGTYGYFKEHALFGGDFKDSVKEQPGSSAVVQSVATDRYAIGYSGIGYKTADVKAVALAAEAGEPFVAPVAKNAYSGEYPLARFLYITVNYKPGTELDPLRREFLRYVFSRQGQLVVVKDGYFPMSGLLAGKALQSVGIASPLATSASVGQ